MIHVTNTVVIHSPDCFTTDTTVYYTLYTVAHAQFELCRATPLMRERGQRRFGEGEEIVGKEMGGHAAWGWA